MAPELQIRCLGRLSLNAREAPGLASRELSLPATLKSQSLLAYLVLHRDRPQSRDHLAELFWGDRPEHNARRSLATALWQIRRCLPDDDYLRADATDVQFNLSSRFSLDVTEFETLVRTAAHDAAAVQKACDLYRGEFLEGFYDDWVLSERYRLESLYEEALAGLMAMRESRGEHGAALSAALRLLDQDPLREDAHRAAMRAYCRLGQRHAALAQYERCRQTLAAELKAEPDAETLALRRAIAEGRLAEEPRSAVLSGPAEYSAPAVAPRRKEMWDPLDAAGQAPLVGREWELEVLADGWRAAQTDGCRLLLISGEAGVGKSRLVQAFAERQNWQGVRCLSGRCYEFERLLPYQPLAEALGSLPRDLAADVCAALPSWVGAQVARLAPDILTHSAEWPQPPPQPGAGPPPAPVLRPAAEQPGDGQERLFEAVSRFLARLGGQESLLLLLEDLHWATDSTLQLLHYLARSAIHRLLIVGTLRPEAVPPAHPLATLGRRLERDGLAKRLVLPPLSAVEVETLIGRMSGAGEVAAPLAKRLYRESEGNPFYLIETVKTMFEHGAIRVVAGAWEADYTALAHSPLPLPAGVSETIAARVDHLSAEAQEAVRVAAVAGREFDFELLNAAWGKGEEDALAALDELLRCRLIAEAAAGADYAFTHHKIQEAVYEGLLRHRRLHLHGQVGLAMERLAGTETARHAVELAHHFEQARQFDSTLTDKALHYLAEAGRQAERQSANGEALGYYRRGLEIVRVLPPTPGRLAHEIELQMALTVPTTVVYGYGSLQARQVYDQALALCRQGGETPALFTALNGLARYYGITGEVETSRELAVKLLAIAEEAQDTALLLQAYRSMAGPLFQAGRIKEAQAWWRRGVAAYDPAQHEHDARRFGHDPAVTFHSNLIQALWLLGYPDEALAEDRRLRRLICSWSHPTSLAYAHCYLAMGACLHHDAERTSQDAEEAMELGHAHGLPSWTALARALQGWALVEQGRPEPGLAYIKEGTTAWRARGFKHLIPFLLTLQAEACLKVSRLDDAAAALAPARTIVEEGTDIFWQAEVDRLSGELLWLQGEEGSAAGGAEARFRGAVEVARRQEAKMLELRASISLARLLRARGRVEEAGQLLAEIYGRFDEGFATPELQTAAALLGELAQARSL